MAELFLDTTVLIDVLRGRPAAQRLLTLQETSSPPYICAINVEEIWRGIRQNEEQAAGRLLNGLRLAPLTRREGQLAGTWRRLYAARGITLSQSDCLIAAAAAGVNANLATGNPKDFPMLETLEHWPVGE